METKHTPGPWQFRNDEGWRLYADGICIMGDEQYYPWVPDNEADWHLIATAPELLEALSPFVLANSSEEFVTLVVRSSDIAAARAVIAKATGKKT